MVSDQDRRRARPGPEGAAPASGRHGTCSGESRLGSGPRRRTALAGGRAGLLVIASSLLTARWIHQQPGRLAIAGAARRHDDAARSTPRCVGPTHALDRVPCRALHLATMLTPARPAAASARQKVEQNLPR